MKCGYKYCKFGGEVDKKDAVKVGNRYLHKECDNEKNIKVEIKDYYYKKFESKESIQIVNGAIKKYINDQGFDAGYVLWCIKNKAKVLNSIYGLGYTLTYKLNEKEYKTYLASITKIEYDQDTNSEFNTTINKNNAKKNKKWGDLFV